VPLLASIPILGHLFRYDSEVQRKTELLIILTPRVIWDEEDAELIKQVESARISWVLSDVQKMHGVHGLRTRWESLDCKDIPVIYPDQDPRGMMMEHDGVIEEVPPPGYEGMMPGRAGDLNYPPQGAPPGPTPGPAQGASVTPDRQRSVPRATVRAMPYNVPRRSPMSPAPGASPSATAPTPLPEGPKRLPQLPDGGPEIVPPQAPDLRPLNTAVPPGGRYPVTSPTAGLPRVPGVGLPPQMMTAPSAVRPAGYQDIQPRAYPTVQPMPVVPQRPPGHWELRPTGPVPAQPTAPVTSWQR
jgi:hypothetical protein